MLYFDLMPNTNIMTSFIINHNMKLSPHVFRGGMMQRVTATDEKTYDNKHRKMVLRGKPF